MRLNYARKPFPNYGTWHEGGVVETVLRNGRRTVFMIAVRAFHEGTHRQLWIT